MASELAASKSAYCDENTCTRQSNVFSSQYAEFDGTSSDAIIFKTKDFFFIFYCVSDIYMKWRTFSKKGESSSLSISEIIDSKRGGYLSAWKALLQNSFP